MDWNVQFNPETIRNLRIVKWFQEWILRTESINFIQVCSIQHFSEVSAEYKPHASYSYNL